MIKRRFLTLDKLTFVALCFILLIASASSMSVSRSFSNSSYLEGFPVNVTLNVSLLVSEKIINYGLEENIPSGWKVILVSSSDFYKNTSSKITWIVNSSTNNSYLSSKLLRYTIIPTQDFGQNLFSGIYVSTYANSTKPVVVSASVSGASVIVGNTTQSPTDNNPGGGGGGGGGGSGGSSSNTEDEPNSNSNGVVNQIVDLVNGEKFLNDSENNSSDNSNNEEKPFNIMLVIFPLILIILILTVIFFLVKRNNEGEIVQSESL